MEGYVKNNFVCVNENYFSIEVDGGGGFKLKPASFEEICDREMEEIVLKDVNISGSDNLLQECIDEVRTEMKDIVKKKIKDLAFASLGLEYRFEKWDIRNSSDYKQLASLIGDEVRDYITEESNLTNIILTDKEKFELRSLVNEEFKSRLKSELAYAQRDKVSKLVNNFVESTIEDLTSKHLGDALPQIMEKILKKV